MNIISNTFTASDNATGFMYNHYPTFNPIDKIVELYDEKVALYERMLKEKDEMMGRLERLIDNK